MNIDRYGPDAILTIPINEPAEPAASGPRHEPESPAHLYADGQTSFGAVLERYKPLRGQFRHHLHDHSDGSMRQHR